ncbi:DUF4157 domain-containing protein [Nodosilinea sp. E11]|uniref:eCIS core domain-containing protein n=1 Tax=Nodosilinea sp. E11 TaxID=3037479 RepID=UPI002934EE54|nr:DUF4157 domain-containing protein [Nodosilinea sp. E11]WOD37084.1 DUF4157 domain-containing protein [Nodosilinea sp. E11]
MKPLTEQIQRVELPEEDELQMKPLLQREMEPNEEDELQMKPDSLQREVEPDEEDELQMKPLLQRQGSEAVAASDDLESAIQQSRGSGQPLADSIREPMEQAFGGVDFSRVKVHTDERADALNRTVGARAFTTKQDLFFRRGEYQPGSQGGQELIAHELTHAVQQSMAFHQDREDYTPPPVINAQLVDTPFIQCKSTITNNANLGNKDTPLKTLHDVFGKYFNKALVNETYNFHPLQVFYLGATPYNGSKAYKNQYLKAEKVEASIDPASSSKTDSKNRNDNVIQPYGHFGVMERAIFDRKNIGNIYDGGHLVEHTLMEGQDADAEGNLAPQQNKQFNQGLMRGWEDVPEKYMHNYNTAFNYTVQVGYDQQTYQRTGKQIRDAGVLGSIDKALPGSELNNLDAEMVTFERWIPSQWKATVADPSGMNNLPQLTLTKGAHWNAVVPSQAQAEGLVFNSQPAPYTGTLKRTNSGMLGGFIETAQVPTNILNAVTVGNQPSFSAYMFQPIPEDTRDQPVHNPSTGAYGGQTPATLPSYTPNFDSFPSTVDFSQMVEDIYDNVPQLTLQAIIPGYSAPTSSPSPSGSISIASRLKKRKPKAATLIKGLDGIGKKHSKSYSVVRQFYFKNADQGGAFIKALIQTRYDKNSKLTKTDLISTIHKTNKHQAFSRKNRKFKLLRLPYEKKLQ